MSKEFTKDDVIANKKEAIKSLNQLLESLLNDGSDLNEKHLKKANLISYWIKDYVNMLKFEEKFEPTKNISYKRGNVVKLNFGFNIGSEYGGLHYGIVLDNKNNHSSPVVTIIPLTSIKENRIVHENSVDLGNELYKMLKLKYDTISKSLKEEQEETNKTYKAISALIDNFEKAHKMRGVNKPNDIFVDLQQLLSSAEKLSAEYENKSRYTREQLKYLSKIGSEISQMKEGSIALVNQITTVSKIRIFDPRNLKGVLAGVSLSAESMDKINQKVKDLYIFSK